MGEKSNEIDRFFVAGVCTVLFVLSIPLMFFHFASGSLLGILSIIILIYLAKLPDKS